MSEIVPFAGWTPERVEELRAYAAEGLSAAQIAYRMKPLTELAIIGRAARLGIELGVKPPKASAQRRSREALTEDDPMFGAAPPARADAWIPLPGTLPVELLDRTDDQCPWPVGEGAAYACCGAPKVQGLPTAAITLRWPTKTDAITARSAASPNSSDQRGASHELPPHFHRRHSKARSQPA